MGLTAAVTVATVGLFTAEAGATAAAPPDREQVGVRVEAADATAAGKCYATEFGYTGEIRCGSSVLRCNWYRGPEGHDEAFAIAPSGTVWHAWENSGGWHRMPNGGTADQTWACYWNGNGHRQVEVWTSSNNVWYSYYDHGWHGWYYKPGS